VLHQELGPGDALRTKRPKRLPIALRLAASALADRRGEGNALWNMGLALEELGERERAIDLAEQPLALFDAIEDPRAEKVRRTLAEWRGGKKRRWWRLRR